MKTDYLISLRRFSPLVLLLTVFCFLCPPPRSSQALVTGYGFTTGSGSRININSGTTLWSGKYRRKNLASGAINLGFTFNFDGVNYTQMQVYNSGIITLGPNQINNIQNNSLSTVNVPTIAGWWDDIGLSGGAQMWGGCPYTPTVRYQMIGNAPSRTMVIEWDHISVFNHDVGYYGEALSTWQIRLYESGKIELYYDEMTSYDPCGGWGGQNYPTNGAIGMAGGSGNYASITPTGGNSATRSFSSVNRNINLQNGQIANGTLYSFVLPNVQLSTAPKTLSFGVVQAGFTSAPLCMTVKHAGTEATLTINSATITGSSDFAIVSSPPSNNYGIGATGQYCITFKPSQAGIRVGTLTINSNGRDSGVQTVTLTGVGIVADMVVDSNIRFKKTRTRLGDTLIQYVHITSTGQAPLFISNFAFSGVDAGQYFIARYPANPIQPGLTDSLGIAYAPTIEGKHVATLTLTSNSFTFPTFPISLQGTGTLPHIVVTPTLLLFDSTREGDTVCKNITIWNPGTDTLRILANILSSNDGDFHYTGLTGADTAIAPDHTKTVTICFIPKQQGTRQARLLLKTNIIKTYEIPRRDTAGIVTVDIRGTGVPFGIFANSFSGPPVLDSATIGTEVCRFDTLKNNGDADILVTGFSFTGGVFSQTGLPATPFLLKARSSIVFNVCATPNAQGITNGSLVFTGSTGGSTITENILLGVYGLKACVAADPNALFVGVLLPNNGSDSSQCVWIHNCGDIASVYSVTINGAQASDYSVQPTTSTMIQPKDSFQFCVDFKPTAVRVSNASLDVASTDHSSVSVPLTGAAGCAQLAATVDPVPNTAVFDTSSFFNITINNTGSFDWTPGQISDIVVTPNTEFSVISVTVTGHAPTQQIVIKMRFLSRTLGNFSAKVTFPKSGPCGDAGSIDVAGAIIQGGVKEITATEGFILDQTYPNPTMGNTNFTYVTPRETEVRISVVDLTGKLVRTLITGRVTEGEHLVNFDASNLPSGTYAYILESGSVRLVRQFILTK
ncbi:MAG: choice-of-anchor D domain-containing protein [Bacteroidota bacterium]|nr:choice-of-anchor D domain-containing protein [Bacteroidota bacterium]